MIVFWHAQSGNLGYLYYVTDVRDGRTVNCTSVTVIIYPFRILWNDLLLPGGAYWLAYC